MISLSHIHFVHSFSEANKGIVRFFSYWLCKIFVKKGQNIAPKRNITSFAIRQEDITGRHARKTTRPYMQPLMNREKGFDWQASVNSNKSKTTNSIFKNKPRTSQHGGDRRLRGYQRVCLSLQVVGYLSQGSTGTPPTFTQSPVTSQECASSSPAARIQQSLPTNIK